MKDNVITIYESADKKARFYFSHSDSNLTTGVLVLQPGCSLPKHNRPHAIENLTQISGKCMMTLFDEKNELKEIELIVGEGIKMPKAQWHIHANPYKGLSVTLFIAQGNILDIMEHLKKVNTKIETNKPKNL